MLFSVQAWKRSGLIFEEEELEELDEEEEMEFLREDKAIGGKGRWGFNDERKVKLILVNSYVYFTERKREHYF